MTSNQGVWAGGNWPSKILGESESRIVRPGSPQRVTTKFASEMTIKLNDTILDDSVTDPDVIADEKLSSKVRRLAIEVLKKVFCKYDV